MGRLDLRLLGAPRIVLGGQERKLGTRKALALMAYLAAEGEMHRRDALAELLWPGRRGVRFRPHSNKTARKARGLEATLMDLPP